MTFSTDQTKALLRLKGAAEEIARASDSVIHRSPGDLSTLENTAILRGYRERMTSLLKTIEQLVDTADPELAREFRAVVGQPTENPWTIAATGAALVGWLRGTVDAETFEHRVQVEADAYARERIRAERPTGFAPPNR